MAHDFTKMAKMIEDALSNMSQEEIEEYFPSDKRPKGWLSIDEYLPMMYAVDIMQGYSVFKVKDINGNEFESKVSDHNTWYYFAKENEITHWLNE